MRRASRVQPRVGSSHPTAMRSCKISTRSTIKTSNRIATLTKPLQNIRVSVISPQSFILPRRSYTNETNTQSTKPEVPKVDTTETLEKLSANVKLAKRMQRAYLVVGVGAAIVLTGGSMIGWLGPVFAMKGIAIYSISVAAAILAIHNSDPHTYDPNHSTFCGILAGFVCTVVLFDISFAGAITIAALYCILESKRKK